MRTPPRRHDHLHCAQHRRTQHLQPVALLQQRWFLPGESLLLARLRPHARTLSCRALHSEVMAVHDVLRSPSSCSCRRRLLLSAWAWASATPPQWSPASRSSSSALPSRAQKPAASPSPPLPPCPTVPRANEETLSCSRSLYSRFVRCPARPPRRTVSSVSVNAVGLFIAMAQVCLAASMQARVGWKTRGIQPTRLPPPESHTPAPR